MRDLLEILVGFVPKDAQGELAEVVALHREMSRLEGRKVRNEGVDLLMSMIRQVKIEWRLNVERLRRG